MWSNEARERGLSQYRGPVPELPEVEALVEDLSRRLDGRAVVRVDIAAFSCLKTYDPPITALAGGMVDRVTRHGKFLDIDVSGTHLVLHLARAGWVRWKDEVPPLPARPNSKSPLAARIVLDNGAGLDITEAGTRKSLALYVVRDPAEVEGIARLGPDPLADDFTIEVLRSILDEGRPRADQGGAAPPEQHRGHRQRLLRRAAARREDVPVQAVQQPRRRRAPDAVRRDPHRARRRGDAVRGPGRQRAQGREEEPHGGARPHRPEVPGVRRRGARGAASPTRSLQYCPTCQTGGKPLADRRMSKLLK